MSSKSVRIQKVEGKSVNATLPITRYIQTHIEIMPEARALWVDGQLRFEYIGALPPMAGAMTWLLDPFEAQKLGLCKVTEY